MSDIVLRVEQLPEANDLPAPAYMTERASGLDLRAAVESEVSLAPGEFATIPTGIRISLPPGHEGQVRPRSGLAARHGVTLVNAPGTIDADYRGEVRVV
ncbi:MAG: dUTP diphosphatase, partial [Proteobacteria bacterium]|nr:dUTP diphosphatase [Pseudomonadota bacterium]